MALTLGGVSSALVGFTNDADDQQGQLISRRTIDVITCCYAPLSVLILLYALFSYESRSRFLRKKQVGRRGAWACHACTHAHAHVMLCASPCGVCRALNQPPGRRGGLCWAWRAHALVLGRAGAAMGGTQHNSAFFPVQRQDGADLVITSTHLCRGVRICAAVCTQMGFFDDKVGPIVVAVLVFTSLVLIFGIALVDYFY